MKKYIFVVFLSVAALLLFASCRSSAPAASLSAQNTFSTPLYQWGHLPKTNLTLWTQERETDRPYLRRALERYQQLTGNTPEIVEIPSATFPQQVAQALNDPNGSGLIALSR